MMDETTKEIVSGIEMVFFDFDGVFTDNMVIVWEDGTEGVRCNRSDGMGLLMLKETGIKIMVISTESNPVVSRRCEKLGIPCIQDCSDKITAMKKVLGKNGISLEQTAFMGNDVNDVECMKQAGLPVAVADAYPVAMKHALYITEKPGGHGAVRELCDLLISHRRSQNG